MIDDASCYRRVFAVVVLVVILAVVCLEVYAHFYIQISNLAVVSSEYALTVPNWINGSYTLSSNGAQWLILMQLPEYSGHTPQEGYVSIYIFKIGENKSSFVQSLNLVSDKFDITSVPEGIQSVYIGPHSFSIVSYDRNYAGAVLGYFNSVGIYNVDFTFTFRVYETTLLGIFPLNEATVRFNDTMTLFA